MTSHSGSRGRLEPLVGKIFVVVFACILPGFNPCISIHFTQVQDHDFGAEYIGLVLFCYQKKNLVECVPL